MTQCIVASQKPRNDGYVQLCRLGRMIYAHRLAYEEQVGKIPCGMTVDHLCKLKNCINTEHMEIVTVAENASRRFRGISHCKRGHPFEGSNLIYQGVNKQYRRCRECLLYSKRKYNHKRYNEIKANRR